MTAVAAAVLAALAGTVSVAAAPAPAPTRTVIRPGRVLDVHTGQMRTGLAVVVEGDKITQIGASGDVKAAAGDTTIDLPEATLLPGLIDMHTHLTFDLGSSRRGRRSASRVDTATKTSCPPRFTSREMEWRTASRECSTRFAKSSSTVRT
jgi:cytosine/adenosine deaminase-related metal-dependent hydrolase